MASPRLFPVFCKTPKPIDFLLPLIDMFANLLIILPSTDRKELVFGYLIFSQMLSCGRWGCLDSD